MPCLTWDDSFSLKIEAIDDQHKRLFDLANGLFDCVQADVDSQTIRRALAELIRYTMTHFAAEEAAMEAYGYPGLDKHRQEHQKLTGHVLEFVEKYYIDGANIGMSLVDFLQSWLIQHILGSDHEFSRFAVR